MSAETATYSAAGDFLRDGLNTNALSLPVLPETAQKIYTLSQDEEADMSELSELIHHDQSLAGYVLKVANSAAYGGSESVVTLQQAVSRIGMKLLGSIALAISMQKTAHGPKEYDERSKAYFRHALLAGAISKELARLLRRNVEGQFLCGMMHNMGKPVVLKLVAEWAQKNDTKLALEDLDRLIEQFHLDMGRALAEAWQLPQQIQITSQYYQNPEEAPRFLDETRMTHLACRLSHWFIESEDGDASSILDDPNFEYLNIYPDDAEELVNKREEFLSEAQTMEI